MTENIYLQALQELNEHQIRFGESKRFKAGT